MRNNRKFCSIVLCIVLILSLIGCSNNSARNPSNLTGQKPSGTSAPKPTTLYAQGPKEVIEQHFYYQSVRDAHGYFSTFGIVWNENLKDYFTKNNTIGGFVEDAIQLEDDDIVLKNLNGDDYDSALEKISKNWLNDKRLDIPYAFVYTASDIQEIHLAYFSLDGQEALEAFVVKTSLGWFIAPY